MKVIPKELFFAMKTFSEEYPDVIWNFIFRKVKSGVVEGKEKVYLFRVDGLPYVALIKREAYPESLNSAMQHFVTVEEYELAEECKKLIDQCKIDQVIRDSATGV